jgi:putative membrane protein
MLWFLVGAAALHVLFMIAELFPWRQPVLLRLVSEKLPHGEHFTAVQQHLVATIVHNAGVYNGIVAGGLLWAAFGGRSAAGVALVMLLGATVAGAFGTATLKSPVTAVQAVIGIIGLLLI